MSVSKINLLMLIVYTSADDCLINTTATSLFVNCFYHFNVNSVNCPGGGGTCVKPFPILPKGVRTSECGRTCSFIDEKSWTLFAIQPSIWRLPITISLKQGMASIGHKHHIIEHDGPVINAHPARLDPIGPTITVSGPITMNNGLVCASWTDCTYGYGYCAPNQLKAPWIKVTNVDMQCPKPTLGGHLIPKRFGASRKSNIFASTKSCEVFVTLIEDHCLRYHLPWIIHTYTNNVEFLVGDYWIGMDCITGAWRQNPARFKILMKNATTTETPVNTTTKIYPQTTSFVNPTPPEGNQIRLVWILLGVLLGLCLLAAAILCYCRYRRTAHHQVLDDSQIQLGTFGPEGFPNDLAEDL